VDDAFAHVERTRTTQSSPHRSFQQGTKAEQESSLTEKGKGRPGVKESRRGELESKRGEPEWMDFDVKEPIGFFGAVDEFQKFRQEMNRQKQAEQAPEPAPEWAPEPAPEWAPEPAPEWAPEPAPREEEGESTPRQSRFEHFG
jgi:hypothetical protein